MQHFQQRNNNQRPTQAEIDAWISQLPATEFDIIRRDAVQYFDFAAKEYLAEHIEQEKKKAVDESVLAEVKQFTSPLRHVGIALLMAIVAPLLLGGMFLLYEHSDDIHFTLSKSTPTKPTQ